MKTTLPKDPGDNRDWLLVDAKDKILGRLAVDIANALRGKNNPLYTSHIDMGSFVVVVNADKVKLTGRKEDQKIYQSYSGYRGGLKETKASALREKHPDQMIKLAVRGMLPKNTMGRKVFKRLKAYAGSEHPHAAQKLKKLEI